MGNKGIKNKRMILKNKRNKEVNGREWEEKEEA